MCSCALFVKVIEVIRHPHDKVESKYNTDFGISKEEEERYQKLLVENEALQKAIVEVSIICNLSNLYTMDNFQAKPITIWLHCVPHLIDLLSTICV